MNDVNIKNHGMLTNNVHLPDHTVELSNAEFFYKKLKTRYNNHLLNRSFSGKEHTTLYEDTMRVLDYVGRLSMHAFSIGDDLEEMYIQYYKHAPQLGKQLWLDHYNDIHKPYNTQKNRYHKLIEDIDELYQNLNNENPPNWNP